MDERNRDSGGPGPGCTPDGVPDWVPDGVRHYLAHTERGRTIRALARDADVHASTILRQVRRCETLRDDPLVDRALRRLSQHCRAEAPRAASPAAPPRDTRTAETVGMDGTMDKAMAETMTGAMPEAEEIAREGLRILRRLAEPGTVLAVARDMEMGVVVRDSGEGAAPQRVAVVGRPIAEAMALKDWIGCDAPEARVARYRITGAGRAALKQLMAEAENRALGFAETQDRFDGSAEDPALRHMRTLLAESPLAGLARRQDRDGQPFLPRDLVAAAERLREDFELCHTGARSLQDWESYLAGGMGSDMGGAGVKGRAVSAPVQRDASPGGLAARARVEAALADLGPGLADVSLRCCCFLEGLESLERQMGWSARSGKIVLRIALQRLRQHYLRTQGRYGPMIG